MILVLKALFLFIGIWFTIINTIKVYTKDELLSINVIIQSIGIAGFIFLMWVI